jgi:hypothetical protein
LGAWGTAIFSDDTASDVREEWRDAILDGLSPEEATQRLLETFDDYLGDADTDTEKLFWMALAAAQMETGRLLPEARDRALAIIDAGGDVDRWREDGDESLARQRARVLEHLAGGSLCEGGGRLRGAGLGERDVVAAADCAALDDVGIDTDIRFVVLRCGAQDAGVFG